MASDVGSTRCICLTVAAATFSYVRVIIIISTNNILLIRSYICTSVVAMVVLWSALVRKYSSNCVGLCVNVR